MEKLTHSEEEAMLVFWKLGAGSIKEVQNQYPQPLPPYTTLASIAKKLEAKGYLETTVVGITHVYKPLISQEAYKSNSLSRIVDNFFGHSLQNLITFYAEKEKISVDELKDMIKLIEKGRK